jgi:hypothetical protein
VPVEQQGTSGTHTPLNQVGVRRDTDMITKDAQQMEWAEVGYRRQGVECHLVGVMRVEIGTHLCDGDWFACSRGKGDTGIGVPRSDLRKRPDEL